MYCAGAVDHLERRFVTGFVAVVPRTHAVMTKQDALCLRVFLDQLLDLQADIETRTLPRNIDDVVAIDLFRQLSWLTEAAIAITEFG